MNHAKTCWNAATRAFRYAASRVMHSYDLGTGGELDERTITLACRHTFTIETLDGVADLNKFYTQDSNSKWISTSLPELSGEIRPRPVCPTCRAPITSRRYGRVFKRADLDVLEHNVASAMSSELFSAQGKLQDSRKGVEATIVSSIKSIIAMSSGQSPMPSKKQQETASKERAIISNKAGDGPTHPEFLSKSLSKVHFIHVKQQAAWSEAVEQVIGAYNQAFQLFDKRSSHYIAYEGSLAALYREELEKSLATLNVSTTSPEHIAMRLARLRIGETPPPRTDKRFLIESFWVIIEILLLLGRMAQRCSELLSSRKNDAKLWRDFAYFLLGQAKVDAQKALNMAQASESHRKTVSCNLLLLRAEMDLARYHLKDQISAQEMTTGRKEELEGAHARTGEVFKRHIREVEQSYRRQFSASEQSEANVWLRTNFGVHTDTLIQTWDETKKSIRLGTWYATVTDEEKMSIVKAFGFYHVGHFYRCPNGHPYVITECGGAMQESRCPECRAPIGGGSHTLRSDNTRDTELVALARRQGSGASPWR
ncbi:hypothetical protein RhiJN_14485 [Ceratobasidium sp. AG-Ba]|nr:hypothetical protein RhiJN_14485 [Ceratobasidium sp. AG-Ba]QRW15027.1 hypothetical protein RhiLY_14026 [Ceratobasidium sp. AG-Ba]